MYIPDAPEADADCVLAELTEPPIGAVHVYVTPANIEFKDIMGVEQLIVPVTLAVVVGIGLTLIV